MENTYKPKTKTRYDVLLTGITGKTPNEIQSQVDSIKKWTVGARIVVSGNVTIPQEIGYVRVEKPRQPNDPLLREVFGNFMMETPGGKSVAICNADVPLSESAEQLMAFIDAGKMGLAWAAYAGTPWPELFVMSGSIVHHFFRDIPVTLKFSGTDWRVWMDEWMNKNLTGFRYFNGNAYGLIKEAALPVLSPVQNVYDLTDVNDTPKQQEPVKMAKKRGRPKKVK